MYRRVRLLARTRKPPGVAGVKARLLPGLETLLQTIEDSVIVPLCVGSLANIRYTLPAVKPLKEMLRLAPFELSVNNVPLVLRSVMQSLLNGTRYPVVAARMSLAGA